MWPRGVGRGYRRRGYGGGGDVMGAMLMMRLLAAIQQLPVKPPVTIGAIGLMVGVFYLGKGELVAESCISASILKTADFSRLLMAGLVHASSTHLGYNMLSFVWKGSQLELHYGSIPFLILLLGFTILSHFLYVILASVGGWDSCAVGFSAVIFALKVVLTARAPGESSMWGFRIPSRYAAWAELVLASLFNPRASFLGHFCGILVGYAFVFLKGEQLLNHLTAAFHHPSTPSLHANQSRPAQTWEEWVGVEAAPFFQGQFFQPQAFNQPQQHRHHRPPPPRHRPAPTAPPPASSSSSSEDERLARAFQAQFDAEARLRRRM